METPHPTITPAREIACDESGWEGANLVAGNSDVIAYASVRLSIGEAAECLRELGGRDGHVRQVYKASHVLRADRSTLASLLGPAGPIHGNAFVHLTEKAYFVVGRLLDFVLGQSAEAASAGVVADRRLTGLATTLSREGPGTFGRDRWQAFLVASNAVLRTKRPRNVREPVDAFVDLVETLAKLDGGSRVGAILDELRRNRSVAYAARARLLEHRALQPALEPLIPSLARTILHWSRDGASDVSIVHDEQSALTERRIRRLEHQLLPPERRLWFTQVDSRTDPRVQVADVLAGVARRLAADELRDRGDTELGELLRAYIDPASRWSDERSWSRLGPAR
ncbi:hypothetical protein [Nonomuraea turcica]|uniref:hypothetical protein n=1 Tax=Nonomuraea sp. G32 TaxID=3067274 RepID=UPI00273AEF7A|nr:hypothetical protein [Nonomuraea sp. G32]MDP4501793.1 hypothetical protein [Nonomuraea sp. G32]